MDLRPAIDHLELVSSDLVSPIDPALQSVDAPIVRIRMRMNVDGSIRPNELLCHVLGIEEINPVIVIRTRLIGESNKKRYAILDAPEMDGQPDPHEASAAAVV